MNRNLGYGTGKGPFHTPVFGVIREMYTDLWDMSSSEIG
jgi:hypothetical protein